MNRTRFFAVVLSLLSVISINSCKEQKGVVSETSTTNVVADSVATINVVIVVMDGPRYSETWGDSTHQYIPHMAEDMAPNGVVYTNFRNRGETNTVNGHTAITTGFYEAVSNDGWNAPEHRSILQRLIHENELPKEKVWLITSKDKLNVLSNTKDEAWADKYQASLDCGNNGPFSGYKTDSVTYEKVMKILKADQPQFLLINFREPDYSGHQMDWEGYLKGIRDVDEYSWEIWDFLQNDPHYKGNTVFIMTNDHGRHLDGIHDGYVCHGDTCEGCTHINLFASGPNIKTNTLIDTERSLIDINATVCHLLGLVPTNGSGEIMQELFE